MIGKTTRYDPNIHMMVDVPVEKYIKRHIPDKSVRDDVFVYRHLKAENFVVAVWANNKHTRFQEIQVMGSTVQHFTKAKVIKVLNVLNNPTTGGRLASELRNSKDRNLRRLQIETEEKKYWERERPKILKG